MLSRNDARNQLINDCSILLRCRPKYIQERSLTVATSVITCEYTQERSLTAANSMIAGNDTQGRIVIAGKYTQARSMTMTSMITGKGSLMAVI